MLSVIYAKCLLQSECCFAECHLAECRFAECHFAECHFTECRFAECRCAFLTTLEWQSELWRHSLTTLEASLTIAICL
jgi:Pentapeptide repeats (9 copies)